MLGVYPSPRCDELARLISGLQDFLNQRQRRFQAAASFEQLCIVFRCCDAPPGKYPQLRKHPNQPVLGVEVRLPPKRIKRSLNANIPLLTEAVAEVIEQLRRYYQRNRLPVSEIDALEQDYWSAFNV